MVASYVLLLIVKFVIRIPLYAMTASIITEYGQVLMLEQQLNVRDVKIIV